MTRIVMSRVGLEQHGGPESYYTPGPHRQHGGDGDLFYPRPPGF